MKNITIVLGTARKGRKSERVFKALIKAFGNHGEVEVTGVDVREHVPSAETVPNWGEEGADTHPTKWKEIVAKTDSFVFILPEYNHGYPGEWKILVDSLFKEYTGKPVYIVGVSAGSFSGVRVADHVKPILVELNFTVHKTGLFIGKTGDVFNEDGKVLDEEVKERMQKFVDVVASTE